MLSRLLLVVSLCSTSSLCSEIRVGVLVSTELIPNETVSQRFAAISSVINRMNNNPNLLGNYSLQPVLLPSQCSRVGALSVLLDEVVESDSAGVVALIDAGCTKSSIATAEISHLFKLTQVSCVSSSPVLDNRVRFPRYFQLKPSLTALAHSYASLALAYQWNRLTFLVEDQEAFTLLADSSERLLSVKNINITKVILDTDSNIAGQFDDVPGIFIIAASPETTTRILCEAFNNDMKHPSHLFITLWEHPYSQLSNKSVSCSRDQIEFVLNRSLAVSNFQIDLENPVNSSLPYCHDATVALVQALNSSLPMLQGMSNGIVSDDFKDEIFDMFSGVSFAGYTGAVNFGENGIREFDSLPIFQYRFLNDSSSGSELVVVNIGQVSASSFFTYSQNESNETVWPEGIPNDQLSQVLTSTFLAITIVFDTLASIGIILALVCGVFNIAFRNRKVVRITSPVLNLFIIGGVILFYIDVCFFVLPTFSPSGVRLTCNITTWLTIMAYTFCYGTIMAKMLRVWLIFRQPFKKKSPNLLKDWVMIAGVMGLLALDIVFLTIYTAIEQTLDPDSLAVIAPNNELPQQPGVSFVLYRCESRVQQIVVGIYYGFKAILQIIAFILAFLTRKVKVKGLDDAKSIAAVIYITTLILLILAICDFTISEFPNAHASVFSTGLLVASTSVLLLLFFPNMVRLYKDPEGKNVFVFTTTNLEGEQVESLKARVLELEERLSQQQQHTITTSTSSIPSTTTLEQ